MQAIVFVAAWIICVAVFMVIFAVLDAGDRLNRELEHGKSSHTVAHYADRQIVTWARPTLYDWAERGDFS